ncbi:MULTISPECIES: acyl carrier protein [Desulfovibrio]|jgi:acyl carrier protein|uniref:acyl carrier protein n=1 Tax=Desulfovibrio TaxID=872 RepID=UPI002A4A345E|nr:acyl carrier protein [Desulfovibrio sp.]MDY0305165.1 acyl carrier protein [Desulfovibrionaceae bacterium]HMM38627.1 acyl carrier protein [Desulfovibrio sp.]
MSVDIKALQQALKDAGIAPANGGEWLADVPLLRQGLDSIDFPAFIALLEDRFKVSISDAEMMRLRTLNDFAAFLDGKAG